MSVSISWREKAEALQRALDKADEVAAYALQVTQWGEAQPAYRERAREIRKAMRKEIDEMERIASGARQMEASY